MTTTSQVQPKRDITSICPVCGDSFQQDGFGRMRKYCSDACKMRAHRKAHNFRASTRREQNTVRTDYLEHTIAYYEARREYAAVDALRSLAHHVAAPIDNDAIAQWRKVFEAELARPFPKL